MNIKNSCLVLLLPLIFSLPTFAETADEDLKIQGIENDKFSREVTINGARLHEIPFGGISRKWFIRSFYNKESHLSSHQLYVDIGYFGSWAFFEWADDEDAKPLKLTSLSKNVNNCYGTCDYDETVVIDLDEQILKNKAKTGYEIKISAKRGQSFVVKVSSEQIRAQLYALTYFARPDQLSISEVEKFVAAAPKSSIPSKVKLGVNFVDLPPAAAVEMKREGFKAVVVMTVSQGSAAEKAGIKMADMIYEYDGKPIQSAQDLQNAVAATEPGSTVLIKALRGKEGKETLIEVRF